MSSCIFGEYALAENLEFVLVGRDADGDGIRDGVHNYAARAANDAGDAGDYQAARNSGADSDSDRLSKSTSRRRDQIDPGWCWAGWWWAGWWRTKGPTRRGRPRRCNGGRRLGRVWQFRIDIEFP